MVYWAGTGERRSWWSPGESRGRVEASTSLGLFMSCREMKIKTCQPTFIFKISREIFEIGRNCSNSSKQMYQVNRAGWDRGLVSKAAMGDNLNKALWKLEIILENHYRQHAVPCSSSFIIIVDPISTLPQKVQLKMVTWPRRTSPFSSAAFMFIFPFSVEAC